LDIIFTSYRETITKVQQGHGRYKQSLAASSSDAWTKFYQQDENAPNAIVSYYTKGVQYILTHVS
jgi:predicted metalloprotease with PDZ domain